MTSNEARCKYTDLPISGCGCDQHHRPEQTVVSIAALERLAGHPLPQYRAIRRPEWKVTEPKETRCDHREDDLCNECDALLDSLLADLPHIVEELGFAMRKDVRFKPHGHRKGDAEHPDEAPLPWSPPAAALLGELNEFMADPPGLRTEQLAELSWIAQRAHRIIERPKDRQITMCPTCRSDIEIPDDDPQTRIILCAVQGCGYCASWPQHKIDILHANTDALLTMTELATILTEDTDPAAYERTRNRIRYLERRKGLARERIQRPDWGANGEIVTEAKWVYRLGDVLDLLAHKEAS